MYDAGKTVAAITRELRLTRSVALTVIVQRDLEENGHSPRSENAPH
jgi:hypothetical protein